METKLISLRALASDPRAAVAAAEAAGRPLLIGHRGEPLAALVDLATLRRLEAELELLRRLALGELESAAGRGHPLAEVLAECEQLLEEN